MSQQFILSPAKGVVAVPFRRDLANLMRQPSTVTVGGKTLLVLKHDEDATRLLRNMGVPVPAPIASQYDWSGGKPFDTQVRTAELLTMNRRAYVLNGMGTGKTRASLWAWHFLYTRKLAGKLLVVAPLSTLNFTWGREIFQILPGMNVQILHGDRKRRLKRFADPTADVYVINHDGLGVIEKELKQRADIDTMIIDELATYRTGNTARHKRMAGIVKQMRNVWGMTGSPTPREPTDAWAQCALITPHTVPKFFNRFRDITMQRITQFTYRAKANALDIVFEAMQPAVRFTLDDVVELPELVERTMDVPLGPKQEAVYKAMETKAMAMIDNKEVTAMNAGAILNKLLQISCGFVYNRDREVFALDNDGRMEALVDTVNSADRKIIVFVPFVHALEGVAKRLTSEGYNVGMVYGGTPKGQRDQIFNLFQNTDQMKVLVAHPQCMAHGLTLTAADTIVWFAPTADLEIFEQANARIRRVGQKHKQLVLMFAATRAEKKMYAKLRAKQRTQDALLEMFATASSETD